MKHAGVHWPNGAAARDELAALPGSSFLLCSPEARWHYSWLRQSRPDALVVWRGIPREGKRPAELDYKAPRIAYECTLHWDEQEHGGVEHFLPLNELNLNYERGDDEGDFDNLETRYLALDLMLQALQPLLKKKLGDGVLLHYPAWAPGHLEWEHLDRWRKSASLYDVIHFHAYGTADEIEAQYRRYREAFPGKPLFLGEWNSGVNGGGPDFEVLGIDEEEKILARLARLIDEDPLFLGATYFIYRWYDGWAGDAFDIEGDFDREELFAHPPGPEDAMVPAVPQGPPPDSEPAINPPPELSIVYTREAVVAISNVIAEGYKIPRELMLACAIAESDVDASARRPSDPSRDESYWPDVSGGAWQQTVRYDPEYEGGPEYPGPAEVSRVLRKQYDAWRSARVAAAQLRRHMIAQVRGDESTDLLQHADNDAVLLATLYRYNWPGGNGKPYSDAHKRNYTDGLARARAELKALESPEEQQPEEGEAWIAAFDRDEYMPKQETDWTCSAATMAWMLRSLGRDMTERDAVDLLGEAINETDGLRYASGTELAGTILGLGYKAKRIDPATFDDVIALCAHGPVGMGGRDFYHWVGVRSYDPKSDVLILANSAPGHKGIVDTMNRSQFNKLGAFAAIGIEAPQLEVAMPDSEDPQMIKDLEDRIAALEDQRDGLISTIGYLSGDVAQALARATDNLEDKLVALKTQSLSELDAIVATLERHKAS